MNQTHRMCSSKSVRHLSSKKKHFRSFQRTVAIQCLLQCFAINEFHHDVGQRLLFDAVDLHNVFVLNGCCRTGFSQKSLPRRRCRRHLHIHHLDGHQTLQLLVERLEDNTESAVPQ